MNNSEATTAYAAIAERIAPGSRLRNHQPLTGGVSADIEALELELGSGEHWTCVVRSPRENEWKPQEHDYVSAEFKLLEVLHPAGLAVPEVLLLDASRSILPVPYFVMELVSGSTRVEAGQIEPAMLQMAEFLARLHTLDPAIAEPAMLPQREDPVSGALTYIPDSEEWSSLRTAIAHWEISPFTDVLLHGDYWPGNVLWHRNELAAVIDWEDAALGSALSDLACSRVELMVSYGEVAVELFTREYLNRAQLDLTDLPVWEVYAGSAALATMSQWGLEPEVEARRREITAQVVQRSAEEIISRKTRG